jgi:hypothetical protein
MLNRFASGKRIIWGALGVLALLCGPIRAETPPSEYEVKAAFLFNFARFVEWPPAAFAAANSPIVLGLYGEDPFGEDLTRIIAGKTANGRPFVIRRCERPADLKSCHMAFISSSEKRNLPQAMDALKGLPVLTVGETDRFAESGGIINFVIDKNRVHFEINVDAADRAGLRMSSKLLSLARIKRDKS